MFRHYPKRIAILARKIRIALYEKCFLTSKQIYLISIYRKVISREILMEDQKRSLMINMFLPERKKGGGNKGETKEAVEVIG